MAQSTPYHSDSSAREQLERELQAENQRIKATCIEVAHIDRDAEPDRYGALVLAMLGALDRQVALDKTAPNAQTLAQRANLFAGIKDERGALDALIAQLRSLSSGDEQSSERFTALNSYVNSNLARGDTSESIDPITASIDWEALSVRMDALRDRLYRETNEDRSRSPMFHSSGGAAAAMPNAKGPGDRR